LLYFVVSPDADKIGIVKVSSEGSKALKEGTETCLGDISLLATQGRA